MLRTKAFRLAGVVTLAALSAASAFAQRGSANFQRYVALGDSLTAGYQSSSLVATHQQYSYPAVIARQTHAGDFQQPLISEPGIPPELRLVSISPLLIAPKSTTNGQPINLQLPRPYNNLGIPGARAINLTTNTGATQDANVFYQIVLRGLGTAADQALALHPTFMTVWIGNNDVLGAVLAGTPAALTPLADFEAAYTALLDRLVAGAPNAGIVTANIPPVSSIPFAVTIPPVIINPATGQPVRDPAGNPIFFFADLGGGQLGQLGPGSAVTLGAASLLATGFGIPPALAPNFPNLPNAGKPLPDAVTLTATEVQQITTRTNEINGAIARIAGARNIPVVDMASKMNEARSGLHFGGITLSTAFLTGGLFSYDGVHPNDIGYTIIANEFIDTINESYDTEIPHASLMPFFANNASVEFSQGPVDVMGVQFAPMTWEPFLTTLHGDSSLYDAPRPGRRRTIGIH
jgi:lysophospholipase L1-like esterase